MRVPSPAAGLVTDIQDPDTSNRLDEIFELSAVEWCVRLRPDSDLARARHQASQYHGVTCVSKFVVEGTVTNSLASHVPINERMYDRDGGLDRKFSVSLDCVWIRLASFFHLS